MTFNKWVASIASAILLGTATLSTPAVANGDTGFSALKGIAVQTLSQEEMAATTGELNAYDIAAALQDFAATLDRFPRLQASVLRVADYYVTNAVRVNAAFDKLGILTPCRTCN